MKIDIIIGHSDTDESRIETFGLLLKDIKNLFHKDRLLLLNKIPNLIYLI